MSPTSYQLLHPASIYVLFLWCRRSESNRYDQSRSQDFKSCASASSATPAQSKLAPRVRLELTAYRLTAGCSTIELPWNINRRRPTFPGSHPPSIISAEELNFCVRYGNRCDLFAIVTRSLSCVFFPDYLSPFLLPVLTYVYIRCVPHQSCSSIQVKILAYTYF